MIKEKTDNVNETATYKSNFVAQWFKSISNISNDDWNYVFPEKKASQIYELHFSVEKSELEGIKHFILKIMYCGNVVAIIPAFSFRIFLDTLAPTGVKKITKKIRRYFKNFATVRTFFLGSPISICDHLLGVSGNITDENMRDIYDVIISETKKKAKKEKCLLIMIKEIPKYALNQLKPILSKEFFFVDSYPNSLIAVGNGLPDFPSFLRSRYKRKILTKMKNFKNENIREKISKNFEIYSDNMVDLYLKVLEKSEVHFETLNENFFKKVALHLKESAFSMMYFSQCNELLCYVLILEDRESYTPLYIGLNYEKVENTDLYFNCVYRIIELAEKNGKKWVRLGQTTYEAKAFMGAVFEKLFLAIHARNKFIHGVMSTFKDVFFPPKNIPFHECINKDFIEEVFHRAQCHCIDLEKNEPENKD